MINRSVVVGVLLIVAYFGMSWEERKAREEKESELRVRLEADQKARQAEQERLLAHEREIQIAKASATGQMPDVGGTVRLDLN